MKKYQASPVTVTKFDADGQVVSSETFVPEKKRSSKQYGDITYYFKVMAGYEDDTVRFVSYAQDEDSALDIASQHLEDDPKTISVWHERI